MTHLLAILCLLTPPIWAPDMESYDVYWNAVRVKHVRIFARYMTGPSGRLEVFVRTGSSSGHVVQTTPWDVRPASFLDPDGDGDIDLKDLSIWLADEDS